MTLPNFSLSPQARWYVCLVNPNCHARAEGELYRLGIRSFYPKLKKWARHARQQKAVEKPVLGRYLFVELTDEDFFRVRRVNGIEGLVSCGSEPVALPEGVVDGLLRRQLAGEWDFISREEMPIGARVKVVEGEFAELLGVLTGRKKGQLTVRLLSGETKRLFEMNVRAA